MKQTWLRQLNRKQTTIRKRTKETWFKPRVEQLEDRLAPATLTWVGDVAGNSNWNANVAGNTNWSGNATPTNLDTLIFDGTATGNFTNNNDTTAGNTYTLQLSGGTS